MNCPKCPTEALSACSVRGVQVDQCPRCGGVWCDPSELPRLLAMEPREVRAVVAGRADPAVNARAGRCPRDGVSMLRVASARKRTVILETCPQCRGVWLDGGELKELLAG